MISSTNKSQGKQSNREVWPIRGKKKWKLPKKDPEADLTDEDFKTTILKMLKELTEDAEKGKRCLNKMEI